MMSPQSEPIVGDDVSSWRTTNVPDYLLHAARAQDIGWCHAQLPQTALGFPQPRFFVASTTPHGECIGVASLRLLADGEGRYLIHVDPVHRGRGVGTRLLRKVIRAAADASVKRLLAGRTLTDGDPTLDFLRGFGMQRLSEVRTFRVDLDKAMALVKPIFRRLVSRGRIGTQLRIAGISEVPVDAVSRFVVMQLGGFQEEVVERLNDKGNGYDRTLSLVVISDNTIAGVLLAEKIGGNLQVGVVAIDPDHRGGFVNVLLRHEFFTRALSAGHNIVTLEADTQLHRDTVKFANRTGGIALGSSYLMGLNLDNDSATRCQGT